MATIRVPYAKEKWDIEVPDHNFLGAFNSESADGEESPSLSQEEWVEKALDAPIGSPSLETLVQGKKSITIITSDHTRPVPSKVTMPILLRRIRSANPDIAITILIATGYHRATTRDELVGKMGEKIVAEETIVVHNAFDDASLTSLGPLPEGGELLVNRLAVETDLLIAEGFIEPHFFAGFSGGRKSVLPGVAAAKTILSNHCSQFVGSPKARTGNLDGNPVHEEMLYAGKKANLAFILNVAINHDKEVIAAFAGDMEKAHFAGCKWVGERAGITPPKADIVVTTNGGYPLDQNIYQAVKGMTAAEAACRAGAVIIMIAACEDGHGGQSFFDNVSSAASPKALLEQVAQVPRDQTRPDQWEFQILARVLSKHTVIMVTDRCDPDMIEAMGMERVDTFDLALKRALELKGKDAGVVVIPDGVSVIVS